MCLNETVVEREATSPPSEELWEKTIDSFLCLKCGYTSNSTLAFDLNLDPTDTLKTARERSPRLVVDMEFFDKDRLLAWYPSVINIPDVGIIHPDGVPNNFEWVVAPYVPLTEDEQSQYDKDSNYTHRLGIEYAKRFNHDEFALAMLELQEIIKSTGKGVSNG